MKLTVVSKNQSIFYDEVEAESNDPIEAVNAYIKHLEYKIDPDDCAESFFTEHIEDEDELREAIEVATLVVQLLKENNYEVVPVDDDSIIVIVPIEE